MTGDEIDSQIQVDELLEYFIILLKFYILFCFIQAYCFLPYKYSVIRMYIWNIYFVKIFSIFEFPFVLYLPVFYSYSLFF